MVICNDEQSMSGCLQPCETELQVREFNIQSSPTQHALSNDEQSDEQLFAALRQDRAAGERVQYAELANTAWSFATTSSHRAA